MIHREGRGGAERRSDFYCPPQSSATSAVNVSHHGWGDSAADEVSLTPDSDVIHFHLLWERRAGVRTADEIASHRNVEEDKELALELRGAVNSSRDVAFEVLYSVQIPFDGRVGAGT